MGNLLQDFLERVKQQWQEAKSTLEQKKRTTNKTEVVIDTSDPLFPLATIIAEKRSYPLSQALKHPMLNFLRSKQQKISPQDQEKFQKAIDNFSEFLKEQQNHQINNMLLNYFASKSGLFLYRCSLLSILFFSKFLNKMANNPVLLTNIFHALSQDSLAHIAPENCDKLLTHLLSLEEWNHPCSEEKTSMIVEELIQTEISN